ncbi:unnamed protein product [Parnassius mnemosyne]|uniref:Las1-like protein n=1 Tax=Parnassius mnemosyne TaxID=213953 RepID=A0AAV1KDK2_9NEOP
MSEYYNVVPWYSSKEWQKLYVDMYSPSSTVSSKEEALKLLMIWKARSPSLPSGIESTLTLLEVQIQDIKNIHTVNDTMLCLAYSTALMRFVNHMLDSQTAKGSSLYKAAKNLGVPDWIVDLRHDTAHGNTLPSIELLREATLISLDWLKKNYWDKHKEFINDYVCGQIDLDESGENKISALMSFCVSLSICAHSKLNIKSLGDIPDINMRESIVNDIRDLFKDSLDLSNMKKVSIRSLINLINTQSKRLLKSKNTAILVNKTLLGKNSIFLSLEVLNFLNDGTPKKESSLSKHYVHCFEVLLTFLHTNDLLQEFILELIKISQNTNENRHKCWLAAVWISEILCALKKSSQFVSKMNKKKSGTEVKKRKDLKTLFYHWFPNEKGCGLLLDLNKPVPKDLTDINFVRPIISSYNEYLTYFIKDILNLIEPQLPSLITEKICKLAKMISSPSKFAGNSTPSKIFTVDDIKAATEDSFIIDIEANTKLSDNQEVNVSSNLFGSEVTSAGQMSYGIWQIVAKHHDWSSCPIGKLPWQHGTESEQIEVNTNNIQSMDTEIN